MSDLELTECWILSFVLVPACPVSISNGETPVTAFLEQLIECNTWCSRSSHVSSPFKVEKSLFLIV